MATEKVKVLKIDTDPAKTSVKELRQELKSLKDTMLSTEEGTQEYNNALQRAADIQHTLKEQMEEVNASAMDFGQIAGNAVKATGGIVAGFQAAQAAMNLFGIENENVIKAMEKMQSLMAITQAIPAIDDGIKGFKRLGLAIKGATIGMSSFKKALMGTGIGLAVVAVGALVANFDKLKAWISGTNKELEEQKRIEIDKHLENVNTQLEKRLSLEEKIRKAGGQDDLTIAKERVKSIEKEIRVKESLIELNRREAGQAWMKVEAAKQAGKAESYINTLREEAKKIAGKEALIQEEIDSLRNNALKTAKEQLKVEEALDSARKIKEKQDEAAKATEEAKKKADEDRKKRIEEEKKALEDLRQKYGELSEDIALFGVTDYQKRINELEKSEQKSIDIVENALKKGVINTEQAEKDKESIREHYQKLREEAEKEEASKEREKTLEMMDISYNLSQTKLQKQYDEKLISEQEFNDRKKELLNTYVQDYVDSIQFMLDNETNLTDAQILDLTEKINNARGLLKEKPEEDIKSEEETTAEKISEAINASALALTDFSDNPAWSNILRNVATLSANWDTLQKQIKEGGTKAFTAYAQIAATALSAVAQMMNGLAAEQDTSNKKGFEAAKKYQIAGATMSMLAGIASAWSSSMQLMFPANIITGSALSAMMLATGIMQIQKIKNTKFEGGSTGTGTSPNTSAVSSVIAPVQYTQDVQGSSIEGAIKDSKVYVTETDISDTQKKVSVTENEAKF